jgi:hypothetical protein
MKMLFLPPLTRAKYVNFAYLLDDIKIKMIAQTKLGVNPDKETGLKVIAGDSVLVLDVLGAERRVSTLFVMQGPTLLISKTSTSYSQC